MKAALCKRLDGPAGVEIEDIAAPKPGEGEALIKVKAAALNFFDTLITRGKYQAKPQLPFSPAAEVAGVVAALGPGVESVRVGDRVMAYLGWGGAREEVVAPASVLVPIPDRVSDAVAAGVSVTYGTAMHGLKDRGRLQPSESVAVLGAAGGAGLAAVEIAKLMWARVIAVASSAEKLEVCQDHGVDVVYDCVGGDASEAALRALAWQGRLLVVGFASGEIPKIALNLLLLKGADAIGVFWGESVKRDPGGHRGNMIEVLGWIAEGKLNPRVHGVYPLEEIREAIGVLERRQAVGKVVLTL